VAEIRSSASYVRHEPRRELDREEALRSLQQHAGATPTAKTGEIWDLLATPQTVLSIARALGATDSNEVKDVLALLYDAELIEVAPDT
jgi:hypothetical protein